MWCKQTAHLSEEFASLSLELVDSSVSPEGQTNPHGIFQLLLSYEVEHRTLLCQLAASSRRLRSALSRMLQAFPRGVVEPGTHSSRSKGTKLCDPIEAVYAIVGGPSEQS